MSAPIGPDDYVECVDASLGWVTGASGLVHGRIYRIEKVLREHKHGVTGCPTCGVVLRDGPNPDVPWDISRFKPIYRPDASLISRLLSDVPTDVPVEA